MNKRISITECEELYEKYATPAHIRRHCKAVCRAALILARELNLYGFNLDLELIRGAALLHDLVRLKENHAGEAAKILLDIGYQEEAAIILVHMDYDMAKTLSDISEVDLVCFGDRVVREDEFVGLSARMEYVVEKARGNEAAINRIRSREKETELLLKEIEQLIGMSIEELMNKKGELDEPIL